MVLSFSVAFLTRSLCGAAIDLSRIRRLCTFGLIAVACAALEATVGEIVRRLMEPPVSNLPSDWLQWVGEDALGLLIATPAVLLPLKRDWALYASSSGPWERYLLLMLTVAVTAAGLLSNQIGLLLLVYPLLVWMAFRSGPPWVSGAVIAVSLAATAITVHGYGVFAYLSHTAGLSEESMVQAFIISVFVCAAPATAALADRNRTSRRLERIHASAREARRAAEQASYAKSQFVANMSHEIRTPLNGVLGMTQAMAKDDLSDVQRERLYVVQRSGEMLLAILNDVLDLSKIEAGKLDLEILPFDLKTLVRGSFEAFAAIADQKSLSFDLTVEPSACGLFHGDATRIRQIIYNLVSNALKFTEAGQVKIVVTGLEVGFSIRVSDTGVGISSQNLERLFTKFEQADVSTTRRFGGTGLGLSICRELTRLMGGRISVESVVGEGSTFTVDLPLERLPDDAALTSFESAPEPDPAYQPGDRPVRLLAAEDNHINQLVLKTLLHQIGISPVFADNGRDALHAWTLQDWDIILMDMQMPVMDGLAASRYIREQEGLTGRPRTPIIALTANAMSHHIEDYRAAGMDAFVSKPIGIAKLLEAISSILGETSETRAAGEDGAPRALAASSDFAPQP